MPGRQAPGGAAHSVHVARHTDCGGELHYPVDLGGGGGSVKEQAINSGVPLGISDCSLASILMPFSSPIDKSFSMGRHPKKHL
jgi:hypothetical protein